VLADGQSAFMQLYGGDRIAHICVIIAEIDACMQSGLQE